MAKSVVVTETSNGFNHWKNKKYFSTPEEARKYADQVWALLLKERMSLDARIFYHEKSREIMDQYGETVVSLYEAKPE